MNNIWLKQYILKHLKMFWSPEQIAGRLRKQNIVVCHETIYQYIVRKKDWSCEARPHNSTIHTIHKIRGGGTRRSFLRIMSYSKP
jgi:IS30 family transposase